MKLDDLCGLLGARSFPSAQAREHPERDDVAATRTAVSAAVTDDEFLVDCMARELDLVESGVRRRGLTPFFTMPDLGIRFSFGYWRPGSTPGPHEHTAWTITAVCRNELEVLTYDREESYRRQMLIPKNRFEAPAGRSGFIYEPCIHNPRNNTDRWSLSFHVTSPRDGERLVDEERSLPVLDEFVDRMLADRGHPYDGVLAARQRQIVVRQVAQLLAPVGSPQAGILLNRCHRAGTAVTRRFIERLRGGDAVTGCGDRSRTLVRTHPELALSHRYDEKSGLVRLGAETPEGWVEELAMSRVARDALAFAARTNAFDVRQLPGSLYEDERRMIAEALEDSGLFTRDTHA
ncbi:hypothetical protein [Kitasatospora griseola]|uniref:hypothetical protein n=1 Tax=Kitasatospora griseola TaxID=2064 RepID=UPI003447A11C